jgi:CrcB protein
VKEWLAVGLGGFVGACGRFALIQFFSWAGPAWWPAATLTANLVGCFAIGWLSQWSFYQDTHHHWLVVGARVGVLGGLTTFSSFALDILRLWYSGRPSLALGLALTHVVLGLMAAAAGMFLVKPSIAD